jgi:hypothetical protein
LFESRLVGWAVILATQEAAIGRVTVQSQPRQKVSETPSQQKAGHGGMYLLSQHHGKNGRPYLKITNAKRLRHGSRAIA